MRRGHRYRKGRSLTILIVDDNAAMRGMIRSMLPTKGMQVYESESGYVVVSEYERLLPDVVLMDVDMPGIDGLTATRRLCDKHPEAKVVMVTNYADYRTRQAAAAAGAVAFIPKEQLMSLPRVVSSIVRRRR